MSKSLKLLLWGLVTLLYLIFACWYFFCCCLDVCNPAVAQYEEVQTTEPIVFNISDTIAVTKNPFSAYRSRILASNGKDSILQIVGYYVNDPNMGIARANEVRKLFPNVPDDLIDIRTSKVPSLRRVADNEYVASEVNWLPPRPVETEAPPAPRVEDLNGKQLIYFPTNSDRKIADSEVDAYLDKVAERVKITGERIELTGHTDDRNTDEYNQALGKRRADKIKQLLVAKGIASDQISAVSKGEKEPTASNNTERGQQANRRVELILVKTE